MTVEHGPWNDHIKEQTIFTLWGVVEWRQNRVTRPGGVTDESFATVMDLASVDKWRLRGPETKLTDGGSGEADVREYVGVVALLHGRMLLVYTDQTSKRGKD